MGATKWWNRRGRLTGSVGGSSRRSSVRALAVVGSRTGRGGRLRVVVALGLHLDHGIDRRVLRLISQPGQLGQHLDPRDHRQHDQRRLPGGGPQLAGRPGGFRLGRRVRRADQGHQLLRQAGQRQRRDQRPEDQPDHRHLRSDQREPDAGPVQDLDRGVAGRLRRPGRDRGLDRRRPALHHPGGAYPVHRRSGPRSPTGPTRDRPTCGGPGPTTRSSSRPW